MDICIFRSEDAELFFSLLVCFIFIYYKNFNFYLFISLLWDLWLSPVSV